MRVWRKYLHPMVVGRWKLSLKRTFCVLFCFSCTLRIKPDSWHFNILPIQQLLQSQNGKYDEKLTWWQFVRTLTDSWQTSDITPHCSSQQTFPIQPRAASVSFNKLYELRLVSPSPFVQCRKGSAELHIWWLFFLSMTFSLVFKNHKIFMILSWYIHPNRCLSVEHTAFTQSRFGLHLTKSKFRLHLNLHLRCFRWCS